jgi:ribonuclease P protein component
MTGAKPLPNGFAPQLRILSGPAFARVYATRWRVTDVMFSINAAPNTLGHSRLGLSIGAKAVGNSVSRNRIKRQIRESFRCNASTLPGFDLVVGARSGARSAHNARLRESLDSLWNQIRKQCVVS